MIGKIRGANAKAATSRRTPKDESTRKSEDVALDALQAMIQSLLAK